MKRETCWASVLLGGAFVASLILLTHATTVSADVCDDPAAGPRACDYTDTNCPPSESGAPIASRLHSDYASYPEAEDYLLDLQAPPFDSDDFMTVMDLGDSSILGYVAWIGGLSNNKFSEGTIWVARVTEDASDVDTDRPRILLVCGAHPNEWIAQETCLGYIDWLVQSANNNPGYTADHAAVVDLLSRVEIWAVVQASPGGRLWDENMSGTGVVDDGTSSGQRKNMQWDDNFVCPDDWSAYTQSGNCSWPYGDWDENTAEDDGVNIARNFSYAWPLKADYSYTRDRVFPPYEHNGHVRSPEEYNCLGLDSNCTDPDMGNFVDHPNCLTICLNAACTNTTDGCFMTSPWPDSLAGYNACVGAAQIDSDGISHGSCLRVRTSATAHNYFLWECRADAGADGVAWNAAAVSGAFAGPNDLLMQCSDGVLVSCSVDADCAVAEANFDATSPHHGGNRYCGDDHYCAVSESSSCCAPDYRGVRPFETIEARAVRELANNIPFAFVLDMHASRADLGYRCTDQSTGCSDVALDNGRGMQDEMVDAYNEAAEAYWNTVMTPGFPDFIRMHSLNSGSGGDGQLPGWMANMPVTVGGVESLPGLNPTDNDNNFDNGTLRAIPSFTLELGATDFQTGFGNLYGEVLRCDSGDTHEVGTRPRSTLMTLNQLEGTKGLLAYLADQVQTPNVATPFSLPSTLPTSRSDVAMVGLRIHDGHGRGIQQSEMRWDEIGGDPEAEIVIPAGYWTVTPEVVAAHAGVSFPGMTLQPVLDTYVETLTPAGGWNPATWILNGETFSLDIGERRSISRRFHFTAGETYRVTASLSTTAALDNDAESNDEIIMKFRVLDCINDTASIPNGLSSNVFCQKGLPYRNLKFECRDVGILGSAGLCKECWLDPVDPQLCEEGALCVDGMCDDPYECLSGQTQDIWEGFAGSETPASLFIPNQVESVMVTRTLHRNPDAFGTPVQDVDKIMISASNDMDSPYYFNYVLTLKLRNHCSTGPTYIGAPIEGLKVKVQKPGPFAIPPYEDSEYVDLTSSPDDNWVTVSNSTGLQVSEISIAAISSGQRLRVLVKNDDTSPESFPYSISASLSADEISLPEVFYWVPEWPWEIYLSPTLAAQVDASAKQTQVFMPSIEAFEESEYLFFRPDENSGVTPQNTQFVLRDKNGEVAKDSNGIVVGYGEWYQNGLAVRLDGLEEQSGPYKAYLMRDDNALRGKVYVCPPGINDCSQYDRAEYLCGIDCDGVGEACCLDANGVASCVNALGGDELNCGGCGRTCEWDEVCLEGVCAVGLGKSCWETECPENMFCVSDNWWKRTNPKCKAILVDNDYCGLWGDTCNDNEICTLGVCLPKMALPCDLDCDAGESCCWVLGSKTCISTDDSCLNCGACGNHCDPGTLCHEGVCEAWYDVLDPCIGTAVNCGRDGEIDCKQLDDDHDNCGSCYFECPDSAWCENGECVTEGQNAEAIDD